MSNRTQKSDSKGLFGQPKPNTRTAILHIGQLKTGSKSIQSALAGYDDGSTFAATFEQKNHSWPIAVAFGTKILNAGLSEAKFWRERKRYRAEFSAMLKRQDRDRIVISAENIWLMPSPDKFGLLEFIHRHGWGVQVIAYVREPLGWTASYLTQFLKMNKMGRNVPQLPDNISPAYHKGLSAFVGLLPSENLHVRIFDRKHLAGGNVVEDFCQTLGLDIPGDIPCKNERPSLPAMKLLFRLNWSGLLFNQDPEIVAVCNRLVRMIAKAYAGGERFDSALCASKVDLSDTDWLHETFGIDFRPKAPLPETSVAELEAVLADLSGVDLSGLDALLAGYGIRHEKFITAEDKLHRLFQAVLKEHAAGERDRIRVERNRETVGRGRLLHKIGIPFCNAGRIFAKYLRYRFWMLLTVFRLLSPVRPTQGNT